MWPYRKDKGIAIRPGESIEIGFGIEWVKGKEEVIITTDNGKFVLNEKTELFLEVMSNNADSIKVQLIPDFKNRKIDVVEVLDIDSKQKPSKGKGRISLVGSDMSKEDNINVDKCMEAWDKNIEILDKRMHRYKVRRNIFLIFGAVIIAGNAYLLTVNSYPMRYFNVASIVIGICLSYRLWNSYKELFTKYIEYKEKRSKAFDTIKEK